MIQEINKDILTVEKGVIVHSVNCLGAAGGLAGAIARQWPKNVEEYRKHVSTHKKSITLLGSVFEVNVAHNLFVANLFGQYDVGTSKQQTEYSALISGFDKIAYSCFIGNDVETINDAIFGKLERPTSLKDVYIPYKIGCGLGGGDWNLVEEIIYKIFEKSNKDVFICKI